MPKHLVMFSRVHTCKFHSMHTCLIELKTQTDNLFVVHSTGHKPRPTTLPCLNLPPLGVVAILTGIDSQ